MSEIDEQDNRYYRCLHCGAEPGYLCTTTGKKPYVYLGGFCDHDTRIELRRRAVREGVDTIQMLRALGWAGEALTERETIRLAQDLLTRALAESEQEVALP